MRIDDTILNLRPVSNEHKLATTTT